MSVCSIGGNLSECFVHSCTVDKVQVELSYSIELFLPPSGSLAHSEIVVGEKVVTGLATRSSPLQGEACA